MRLTKIHQQALQAKMSLIVGEQNYDRLFLGAVFYEVQKGVLFCFARTEELAAEIEETYAFHLSIIAGQILRLPIEFVQVFPRDLMAKDN